MFVHDRHSSKYVTYINSLASSKPPLGKHFLFQYHSHFMAEDMEMAISGRRQTEMWAA